MKPSKIIITLEDNLLGCELNDNQGHILDFNYLTGQEQLHIINALDSLRDLLLNHLTISTTEQNG